MIFDQTFKHLTGNAPFPWQSSLYERFAAGNFPDSCILPTGLGKTNVIAVWLIALLNHPTIMPRRLVYVVNRRTVVDQTTTEVERIRDNLRKLNATELALSTLRGQFADNREWSADPSRPAVICGTVDMIGSRLLFSGYNIGFKAKPLHAGFLGQDALLVHDEAHLEPAFQRLVERIKEEQRGRERTELPWPKLRVMAMTATPRGGEEIFPNEQEKSDNEQEPEVQKRVNAKKHIFLHDNADPKKLANEMTEFLLTPSIKDSKRPILAFVQKVDDAVTIATKLDNAGQKVRQLNGTLRGKERDELVKDETFHRFLPNAPKGDETVYLVCTSAGEVGVNISADHLVCDLSTFESMAQRFGRVNRFGLNYDTEIHVFHPAKFDPENKLDVRRQKTLALIRQLNGDGSPTALGDLPLREREAAFAPGPFIPQVTEILFDAWALTTIRDKLPGRPSVETYLHGISEYDPPQTTVAWREEVGELKEDILDANGLTIEDVLELYPLKPHEELTAPTYGKNKVFEQLEKIAERDAQLEPKNRLSAWVIEPDGTASAVGLQELVRKDGQNKAVHPLAGRTVVLPPKAGGLQKGMLDGGTPYLEATPYDVSDQWWVDKERQISHRARAWNGDADFRVKRGNKRLICRIDFPAASEEEEAEPREWHWFVRPKSADDDGSKTSRNAVLWQHHTDDVVAEATRLADALLKDAPKLREALILAARFHDFGKRREQWQRDIGNDKFPDECYAKSGDLKGGGCLRPRQATRFRHEFASLIDAKAEAEFRNLQSELQDLVLHLIAVHHGYGRPHFPGDLAFDPEPKGQDVDQLAAEVPQRFARLQRKFGRWGLAYLESLLRAADWHASANPSQEVNS